MQRPAARFEDAIDFAEGVFLVLHVFENRRRVDKLKVIIGVRDILDRPTFIEAEAVGIDGSTQFDVILHIVTIGIFIAMIDIFSNMSPIAAAEIEDVRGAGQMNIVRSENLLVQANDLLVNR